LKVLVVPFLKTEGQLIKNALSGNDPREKSAAEHLQTIILVCSHCKFLLSGLLWLGIRNRGRIRVGTMRVLVEVVRLNDVYYQ
jgi:hypothetical protein